MSTPTKIHTYHCLCAELLLAISSGPLSTLPRRARDHASICPVPDTLQLFGSAAHLASEASVLKFADGFEKRYPLRCGRCGLDVGYALDEGSFEEGREGRRGEVLYLLPGALRDTEEVREGVKVEGAEVGLGGGKRRAAAVG